MSVAKASHIVFDIGGVLLDWSPDYLYREIIPDPQRRRYFLQEVCSPAWNAGQDRGRSWKVAEDEILPKFPEFREEILAYRARWFDMIAGPIEGGFELLAEVCSTSAQVSILSNWAADTFEVACAHYPALLSVADRTVSGQIGMAKPMPRFLPIMSKPSALSLKKPSSLMIMPTISTPLMAEVGRPFTIEMPRKRVVSSSKLACLQTNGAPQKPRDGNCR